MSSTPPADPRDEPAVAWPEIFAAALKLGCTSFGGPVAHLGYFHAEYVHRRRWLSEAAYADLVALCQFLPGPSSSQVGMGIGYRLAGWRGMCAAWLGFTLPSALLMLGFAYGVDALGDLRHAGWLRGLGLAAVAVVAQAVWTMAGKLCPDAPRRLLALGATVVLSVWTQAGAQAVVIALGAALGWTWFGKAMSAGHPSEDGARSAARGDRTGSAWSLAVFAVLLAGLPILSATLPDPTGAEVFSGFFRTGSLVFGGGHVVLPLLQAQTVAPGWISANRFLAGYAVAQALPGPLFTFAAYLGAALEPPLPHGWAGGLVALLAIFLPSFLLLPGVLPFWEVLRSRPGVGGALRGANAAVVGVLAAAWYDPGWKTSVHDARDFGVALAAFGLLVGLRCPPWLVVLLCTVSGWLLLGK